LISLFQQAQALQEFLTQRGWPFCFIGGIALQHWGEPRVTRDLDIALFTGFGGEGSFIDGLLSQYAPRRPDARQFAVQYRVLLLSMPGGIPVDVALAALPFEAEMIGRACMVPFGNAIALRICSAEDLFVLKAFAHRPQDSADLIGIAKRRGRTLDWDAIQSRLAPLAAVKNEPEILAEVRVLREKFGP
jgi:hypothetical protein